MRMGGNGNGKCHSRKLLVAELLAFDCHGRSARCRLAYTEPVLISAVCMLVITMSDAKAAQPIETPFWNRLA